jgi:hypothetical protein
MGRANLAAVSNELAAPDIGLTTEERDALISLITSEIESSLPFPLSPRIVALTAAGAKLVAATGRERT